MESPCYSEANSRQRTKRPCTQEELQQNPWKIQWQHTTVVPSNLPPRNKIIRFKSQSRGVISFCGGGPYWCTAHVKSHFWTCVERTGIRREPIGMIGWVPIAGKDHWERGLMPMQMYYQPHKSLWRYCLLSRLTITCFVLSSSNTETLAHGDPIVPCSSLLFRMSIVFSMSLILAPRAHTFQSTQWRCQFASSSQDLAISWETLNVNIIIRRLLRLILTASDSLPFDDFSGEVDYANRPPLFKDRPSAWVLHKVVTAG